MHVSSPFPLLGIWFCHLVLVILSLSPPPPPPFVSVGKEEGGGGVSSRKLISMGNLSPTVLFAS